MSAGRSSHDSACFSVDRTKYLMLSKSMPDRSEPQFGMGLRPKYFSPFSRFSSIHSGSFLRAEMSDHLFGEPALGGRAGHVGVGPAELVRAQPFELVIRSSRHMSEPSGLVGVVARDVQVTWVVQIPSPCAIVARRRTGVPRSRPNASVSASHSWGNSAATCATGQWCWQICAPLSISAASVPVPLFPGPCFPASAAPAAVFPTAVFPTAVFPTTGAGPAAAA